MKKRKLSSYGIWTIIIIVLQLALGVAMIFSENTRYIGIVYTSLFFYIPVFSISMKKTVNNVTAIPGMLRVSREPYKDKQEKVDKLLDYMEEKQFSMTAPFVNLIANGLLIWLMIFASGFLNDESFFLFSYYNLKKAPWIVEAWYWAIMVLLLFDTLEIQKKSKSLFSMFCIILSIVFVMFSKDSVSMYLAIITADIGYTLRMIKSKDFFERINEPTINSTSVENAQVQAEENKLDVFEDKTKK